MELRWIEQRVPRKAAVIALARPKSGQLWAVGQTRRFCRTMTALLQGHADGWNWAFGVNSPLDAVGILGDGSVLAAGEMVTVVFDGDNWSTIRSGLRGSRRIWGANPASANALADSGLCYFDGHKWGSVELAAQGIPGDWGDGDCDSSGAGWIVGTYGSHCCVAVGSGTSWQKDGCGSSYLHRIFVGESGRAFAAGGDGLWRHDRTGWMKVHHKVDVSRLPLAVSAVGATPIVVATKLDDHRLKSTLELLTATGWQTIPAPVPLNVELISGLEIDISARLLIAQGSTVWVSSQLTCS